MTLSNFLLVMSGFFGLGFIIPLIGSNNNLLDDFNQIDNQPLPLRVRISLGTSFLGSLLCIIQVLIYIISDNKHTFYTPQVFVSWMPAMPPFAWHFRLDPLAAFFILLIAAFSASVAIYSFGALKSKHYRKQGTNIAATFSIFAWSTIMVTLANDVFTLIIMLEIMSLSFGYLALFKYNLYREEGEKPPDVQKVQNAWLAPQVYMIISHTSTAFLILALSLLATQADSMSFDIFRSNRDNIDKLINSLVFLLAFAGLGIRTGLTPAHVWVSLVHPNSPTTTHALSLGIAIKVSIYCMIRFFFEFLTPVQWWGYVVLLVAVITAVVNVRYALASHDLKIGLAYHSVENYGLIVSGIGVALIFSDKLLRSGWEWVSILALLGSLYHLLNHALFKGLLYLSVGSIDNLTKQVVDIDKLGGLIKWYPWTSVMFLIGSFAISGFPPFNGFISEWLITQTFLKGIGGWDQIGPSVFILVASIALLFVSFVMTALCFYKLSGIALMGEPRSDTRLWTPKGKDSPWSMRLIMIVFAVLCLILGIIPGIVIRWALSPVVSSIPLFSNDTITMVVNGLNGSKPTSIIELPILPNVIRIFIIGLILALGTWAIPIILNRRMRHIVTKKIINSWNGGTSNELALQPSSEALVYLPQDTFKFPNPEKAPQYLPSQMTETVIERFRNFYNKYFDKLIQVSDKLGVIHGDIRRSLLYILVMNMVALGLFLIFQYFLKGGQ